MDRPADAPQAETIILKHQLSELGRLSTWLAEQTERADLPVRVGFRLELALTEAVTNVLEHGLDGSGEGTVAVSLTRSASEIVARVCDRGPAFDPLQVPAHETAESLADAAIGGLGVHLLRTYADVCAYAYRDGQNELSLTFFLSDRARDEVEA